MNIPLNKFEQVIDEEILQRGLSYFRADAISDFSEISTGEYEAIVLGTKLYTVRLRVKNNIITQHNCTCPYDMGIICKHVVAVIFHLQQNVLDLEQAKLSVPQKKKTKSVSQQVNELLQSIPHEELIDFIQNHSKKNRQFRNYFLTSFSHLNQSQSRVFYKKQIHGILQAVMDRDGWIDRVDMEYVADTGQPFLENAEKYLKNSDFEQVFFISTALLEEMTDAFQYADDSDGELGHFIASALELLTKLTRKKLPITLKKDILEYCIATFNQKIFKGWDWHLGILHIASKLIEKDDDTDRILSCLDTINEGYDSKCAQSLKLELLEQFKGEKEAEKFIDNHISNSLIRMREIEKAFKSKNFGRVVTLSKDGIQCDEKDAPGLVIDWYNWLLRAAQAEKDCDKIIEYARFLFLKNSRPEQNYYQILKNNIADEHWYPFLEELIKDIISKDKWPDTELIRRIYINEKWWEKLLQMLKQDASLENIQENECYLAKNFSHELVELYVKGIISYIEKYTNRKHYQIACMFLRRMKKLGGSEQVNTLMQLFREQYPKRKALMDELNRV